jgi:alpha-beta hydrolase superfamily lysophospholipase
MSALPILLAAAAAAGVASGGAGNPSGYRERPLDLELFGVRMPAALTLPASGEPASAIVLIPGSLFLDVDGSYPAWGIRPHVYADLARQLAARGHAVLRYAKIGPGTGSEVLDQQAMEKHRRFLARVDTACAAVDLLLAELANATGTATELPVVLAGHSEGAVVASLAARRDARVAAVVSLSGPSVGLLDVMREQLPVPAGSPPEAYAGFDRAVAAIRAGEPLTEELRADPLVRGLAQMDERSLRYLAEIDAVDPVDELARVEQPVLILQGGRDPSVGTHHADRLLAARGERKGDALARFPELQHFYKRVEEGVDPMTSFGLETESDPAVAEAIDRWVREIH